jgi:hypothetical protein
VGIVRWHAISTAKPVPSSRFDGGGILVRGEFCSKGAITARADDANNGAAFRGYDEPCDDGEKRADAGRATDEKSCRFVEIESR